MKTESSGRGTTDKHKFDFQDRGKPQTAPRYAGLMEGERARERRRMKPCPCESWFLSLAFAIKISDQFVFYSWGCLTGYAQLLWCEAIFPEINLAQQMKSLVSQLNRAEDTQVISREWLVLP